MSTSNLAAAAGAPGKGKKGGKGEASKKQGAAAQNAVGAKLNQTSEDDDEKYTSQNEGDKEDEHYSSQNYSEDYSSMHNKSDMNFKK